MLNQGAQYYRGDFPVQHMQTDDNHWFTLVSFVVFIAIVSVTLLVVYKIATKSTAASQGKDPIDIAKERYAKGEINKEQLADIKKELTSK
jgi:uncharacterized membrane protein